VAAPKRRQRGDEPPKPAGRKPTSGRKKARPAPRTDRSIPGAARPGVPESPGGEAGSRRDRVRALKQERDVLRDKKRAHDARRSAADDARGVAPHSSASPIEPRPDAPSRRESGPRETSPRHARGGAEWIYGRNVAVLALAPGARRRVQGVTATAAALRALEGRVHLGAIKPRIADTAELDELTRSRDHQGIAVLVSAFAYVPLDDLVGAELLVVLDEVADPRNLGAVARSALAAGAGGLILPGHRAAAVTPVAVKASAGACEHLPIAQVTNVTAALNELKRQGFWVYGAAGEAASSYRDLDYSGKVVLVFGSEGTGLRPLVERTCDQLGAIPVAAPLESLNVSVAAALFLYEARRAHDPASPGATQARS
jgi:23S rRNA (guanosine2251-2'-O)-methyltransferase